MLVLESVRLPTVRVPTDPEAPGARVAPEAFTDALMMPLPPNVLVTV